MPLRSFRCALSWLFLLLFVHPESDITARSPCTRPHPVHQACLHTIGRNLPQTMIHICPGNCTAHLLCHQTMIHICPGNCTAHLLCHQTVHYLRSTGLGCRLTF